MIRALIGIATCLVSANANASASAEPYGPCGTFSGSIRIVETYGPPNYGEEPKTDSRMKSTVLTLNSPLRANVWSADHQVQAVDTFSEVQIISKHLPAKRSTLKIRRATSFTGCLYFAESGHHITKVILDVDAKLPRS